MSTTAVDRAYVYREATATDLPQLGALLERFRAESHYARYAPANLERSIGLLGWLLIQDDGVILVVEQSGRPVGLIGLHITTNQLFGQRWAMDLLWYVEPDHRGAGVWLLRRAERWARAHHADRIVMGSPQSAAIDRLYAVLGYAPMETMWQKSLDWFGQHAPAPPDETRHGIQVYDNVLSDPLAYRAMALTQRFDAVNFFYDTNHVLCLGAAGPRTGQAVFEKIGLCADPTVPMWIVKRYPKLKPVWSLLRRYEQGQQEPHVVHTDVSMGDWTAVLYLTPDPPDGDGTAFWRHTASGRVESTEVTVDEAKTWHDETAWTTWHLVPAQLNRMVIFPSRLYHSRAIRENYGHGDEARLVHVVIGTGAL